MLAYHFVGATLRGGRPIPPDGEWLEHDGPLVMCESGLHACEHPADALEYALGPVVCLVELDGEWVADDDKLCARRRCILKRFDATDVLREYARREALSVIHLWDAPPVVRAYLETGDESKRTAARTAADTTENGAAGVAERAAAYAAVAAAGAAVWFAAGAAAWSAARATAGDAARSPAWNAAADATWHAARSRLKAAVDAVFAGMTAAP